MKGLLFSLLVMSPAAFATAPNCNRLMEIASQYELSLKKEIIRPACSEETLPNLVINDIILKEEVIDRLKCASLGVIEERAKTLENKLTLLGGFQILKNEIRENREQTAQENLTKAQRAARDFRRALVTAQSVELLLDTAGPTPIIRELKSIPEERRNTPAKLMQEMRILCSNRQGRENSAQDACSTQFSPDNEGVSEINALISQASLTDEELTTWSNALRIQRSNGDGWSFREMYSEIREAVPKIQDGRLTLTRNELNAIKNLPDFQDVAALPFMNALRSAKSGMAIHTSFEKFKFTALDLKERLQVESRSKISWVWKEIKDSGITLAPEKIAICEASLRDYASAKECWEAMSAAKDSIPTSGSAKKEHLTFMSHGMSSTLAYLNSFEDLSLCLNPEQGQTALAAANTGDELTNCSSLNMLNADLEKIQNELLIINGLREKIGAQNQRDMKFRNFAIEKIATMNCTTSAESIVSCEESPMNVAPVAMDLTSDILGLSIVHVAPANATDLEADCENVTANGGLEADLCKFYERAPQTPNVTDRPAPPSAESPYIEVRDARDPSREAFNDGLAGIGWGIVNQLQNRPQMYNPYANMNPYPYNYNPYLRGGMLSPSDQILFNARFYGGYGFYTPTLGAAPYTAFPVISPYVQAGANSSSYFSNFGTYK